MNERGEDHEHDEIGNDDLAGSGHELNGERDALPIQDCHGDDGLCKSSKDDHGEAEYVPCGTEDDQAVILSISSWRGRLPHPDDLARYDEETRKSIVQIFEDESHAAIERERIALDSSINLDNREADRLAEANAADCAQMRRAQWMTWSLNMGLIAAIVIGASTKNQAVIAAAVVAFSSLTVANLMAPRRKKSD